MWTFVCVKSHSKSQKLSTVHHTSLRKSIVCIFTPYTIHRLNKGKAVNMCFGLVGKRRTFKANLMLNTERPAGGSVEVGSPVDWTSHICEKFYSPQPENRWVNTSWRNELKTHPTQEVDLPQNLIFLIIHKCEFTQHKYAAGVFFIVYTDSFVLVWRIDDGNGNAFVCNGIWTTAMIWRWA